MKFRARADNIHRATDSEHVNSLRVQGILPVRLRVPQAAAL
jgi:hypothetical protein